ncbi:hypothetical protein R50073_06600 [Maricurvus nonylphenolicus]|uniref:hypothetical protein n=1 Tax=Maricurvus nonylphenolicus TaxID=1008307 RepID=UPI0036F3DCE8
MDAIQLRQAGLASAGLNLQVSEQSPQQFQQAVTNKSADSLPDLLSNQSLNPTFEVTTVNDSVTFSHTQRADDTELYEPQALQRQVRFSRASEDEFKNPIDQRLASGLEDFNDSSRWGRTAFTLGDLIKGDYTEYQQHAENSISSAKTELGALALDNRKAFSTTTQAELTLQLTTRDGDVITFSYAMNAGMAEQKDAGTYSFQEIALNYSVEGELSEEEKTALAEFAKGLGAFARDFFTNPEATPDLGSLKLFDSKLIAGVNLELQGSDASFELTLEDAEETRKLDITWTNNESQWDSGAKEGRSSNTLQLLINKHGATEGRHIQKDLALSQQQDIIRESLTDARATSQQQNYIQNAFSAIHQDLYFLPPEGSDAMVTGLADYSLTFAGELELPMRSSEVLDAKVGETAENLKGNQNSGLYEGIKDFQLSQETTIEESRDLLEITQQQKMKLDADFFSAAPHLENPDFSHQTFIHHTIEREFEIVSHQQYDDLDLISATISQHYSNQETITEYNEGKVVDRWEKNKQVDKLVDNTELLRDGVTHQQQLDLVENLLAAKIF